MKLLGVSDDQLHTKRELLKFMIYPVSDHQYKQLFTAEYAIVSLSLSLVIAKFFPAIHYQIVSRVTRVEHQSLYWGAVIVSNIFTYGLLFFLGRWVSLNLTSQSIGYRAGLATLEMMLNIILFDGALVASCRGRGGTGVPIPNGMAKMFRFYSHVSVAVFVALCNVKQRH